MIYSFSEVLKDMRIIFNWDRYYFFLFVFDFWFYLNKYLYISFNSFEF